MSRIAAMKRAQMQAADQYKPRPYPGRITFFRATDQNIPLMGDAANFIGDPLPAWRRYCSQAIEAYDVPGNHISLGFDPHAQALAAQIAQRLLAVDPVAPGDGA